MLLYLRDSDGYMSLMVGFSFDYTFGEKEKGIVLFCGLKDDPTAIQNQYES